MVDITKAMRRVEMLEKELEGIEYDIRIHEFEIKWLEKDRLEKELEIKRIMKEIQKE